VSDDDRTLVERSQAGDLAAFELLVGRHKERAFRLAARVLGDTEEALDVAQEAFVRVYQALPRFKGQSAFYTWLFRIVMNLALDRRRQRAARQRAFGSEEVPPEEWERIAADDTPDPAEAAGSAEQRAKITRALDAATLVVGRGGDTCTDAEGCGQDRTDHAESRSAIVR